MADARLGDVNDPPADQQWAGVLLLCGNLGLGGSWEGNRRLLARLSELTAPGAVLVGDSVTPDGPARVVLRIRCRDMRRGHHRLTVGYHEGQHGPEEFYRRLGFRPTGEYIHGEAVAERTLGPTPTQTPESPAGGG